MHYYDHWLPVSALSSLSLPFPCLNHDTPDELCCYLVGDHLVITVSGGPLCDCMRTSDVQKLYWSLYQLKYYFSLMFFCKYYYEDTKMFVPKNTVPCFSAEAIQAAIDVANKERDSGS